MARRQRAVDATRRAFRLRRARPAVDDPTPAALTREIERLTGEVRKLSRLALTDSLTGLGNRRGWDRQLSRELARSRRSGEPLSVALLDLDGLKTFKKAHGHDAGDRLLIAAGGAWMSRLREADALCRWDGGKFAALLPSCPLDQANGVTARLHAATPQEQSCAVGVACWDGSETEKELLGRADQALYSDRASQRSRNEDSRDSGQATGGARSRHGPDP